MADRLSESRYVDLVEIWRLPWHISSSPLCVWRYQYSHPTQYLDLDYFIETGEIIWRQYE